jgi:hypothetical protein
VIEEANVSGKSHHVHVPKDSPLLPDIEQNKLVGHSFLHFARELESSLESEMLKSGI